MDDLDAPLAAPAPATAPAPGAAPSDAQPIASLGKFTLLRSDDMLDLEVEFIGAGLQLVPGGGTFTVEPGSTGGVLAVTLPPQHLLERASQYVFARLTRLRFRIPPNSTPIPVTTQGVLTAMRKLELVTDPAIGIDPPLPEPGAGTLPPAPPSAGPITVDPATVTELKVSSRMGLSPRGGANRFVHAPEPVTHDGRTELWHTRLARLTTGGRLVEGKTDLVGLRRRCRSPAGCVAASMSSCRCAACSMHRGSASWRARWMRPAPRPVRNRWRSGRSRGRPGHRFPTRRRGCGCCIASKAPARPTTCRWRCGSRANSMWRRCTRRSVIWSPATRACARC